MKYLMIGAAAVLAIVIGVEMQKRTLIAFVETRDAGEVTQMQYPTLADCEVAGSNLRKSFEADSNVIIIWRCVK